MLVRWNKDCLKTFNLKGTKSKYPHNDQVIKLLPGLNDVDNALWMDLKQYYGLDAEIKKGFIQEVQEEGKEGKVTDFKEFSNDDQRVFIEECYNIDTLKQWRTVAEVDIRTVIDDKINEIKEAKYHKAIGASQKPVTE